MAAALSSLEQMWIGKNHKKEKRLGNGEAIQAFSRMGANLRFKHEVIKIDECVSCLQLRL